MSIPHRVTVEPVGSLVVLTAEDASRSVLRRVVVTEDRVGTSLAQLMHGETVEDVVESVRVTATMTFAADDVDEGWYNLPAEVALSVRARLAEIVGDNGGEFTPSFLHVEVA